MIDFSSTGKPINFNQNQQSKTTTPRKLSTLQSIHHPNNYTDLADNDNMKEFSNKEIIIIAGPSASGKSYIISQLKTTKKNKLKFKIFRKLSIKSRKSKSYISISALKNSSKKPKHIRKLNKKIIFIHFDLTGRHQKQKRQLLIQIANSFIMQKNLQKVKKQKRS